MISRNDKNLCKKQKKLHPKRILQIIFIPIHGIARKY